MNKIFCIAVAGLAFAAPAAANHFMNLNVPFATRGACEAAVADYSNGDRESLLDRFPGLFSSIGEVGSFLTRAFPCERNSADGQWYIQDNRSDVRASEWFQRRL